MLLLGLLGAHPGAARRADALEIVAEEAAEPVVDRAEQSAGDEDPGFGDRIPVGVNDAATPERNRPS